MNTTTGKEQRYECIRCHRQLTRSKGMGRTCEQKAKSEVLDSDLTFSGQRFGAQYAGGKR